MKVILYNNQSDKATVGKVLNDPIEYDVKLKGDGDVISPFFLLKDSGIIGKNYCYIEDFKRYYYIEEIQKIANDIVRIQLKVDVLKTYENQIRGSYGVIIRSMDYNKYYDGGDNLVEIRRNSKVYESNKTISDDGDYIIVTIGGGN